MKIKMYGMAPDGEIVRDDAEVIEGRDAREIVQAMMADTPMAHGQPERAFIGDVLARIGMLGYQLRMRALLRSRGLSRQEIDNFMAEATRGDYYRLLGTVMRWAEA